MYFAIAFFGTMIIVLLVLYSNLNPKNIHTINKEFDELIASERYAKADYKIVMINEEYALQYKDTDQYADLRSIGFTWSIDSSYFEHCLGTKQRVMEVFNIKCPSRFIIKSKKVY